MKVKVKVGNISQFHEARYCAGMGVDWIGFKPMPAGHFAEIAGWLAGPRFAWEVESIPETTIEQTILEIPVAILKKAEGEVAIRLHIQEWEMHKEEIFKRKNRIQYARVQLSDQEEENKRVLNALGEVTDIYVWVEEVERLDYYLSYATPGLALTGGINEDYSPFATALEQLS